MVPKVNSGANVYGVLQYNRIKVEAGEGRILYMQGIDGRFCPDDVHWPMAKRLLTSSC